MLILFTLILTACMLQYFAAYFQSWRTFWLITIVLLATCFLAPSPLGALGVLAQLTAWSVSWSIIWNTAFQAFVLRQMGDTRPILASVWTMLKLNCAAPCVALWQLCKDLWSFPSEAIAALRRRARRPSAMIDGRRIPVTILAT
jgi:hypothetical protein